MDGQPSDQPCTRTERRCSSRETSAPPRRGPPHRNKMPALAWWSPGRRWCPSSGRPTLQRYPGDSPTRTYPSTTVIPFGAMPQNRPGRQRQNKNRTAVTVVKKKKKSLKHSRHSTHAKQARPWGAHLWKAQSGARNMGAESLAVGAPAVATTNKHLSTPPWGVTRPSPPRQGRRPARPVEQHATQQSRPGRRTAAAGSSYRRPIHPVTRGGAGDNGAEGRHFLTTERAKWRWSASETAGKSEVRENRGYRYSSRRDDRTTRRSARAGRRAQADKQRGAQPCESLLTTGG